MSTNNKARRAAKARKKRAQDRPRQSGSSQFDPSLFRPRVDQDAAMAERVARLWSQAFHAPDTTSAPARAAITALAACPPAIVDSMAGQYILDMLDGLWTHGWQPVEVVRQARRVNAATARFTEFTILADHHRRRGQRIDPRWTTQLLELGQRDVSPADGWPARWRQHHSLDRESWYALVAGMVQLLGRLPALECLIPPPGATESFVARGPADDTGSGHPMLEKIRKLLAKAEATDFEDEATTLSAKAQELMTRYAIDEALVRGTKRTDRPVIIRLPIDAPYADAKAVLLSIVSNANRCRSITIGKLGLCSVHGYAEDLAAVELLFTSLLVQAQNALAQAGRGPVARRARSTSYRASFYLGYADRIDERLSTANEEVVAQVDRRALPVLRDRESNVEDFVDDLYGDTLTSTGVRGGYDYTGRAHGREAADEATFVAGQIA